MSRGASERWCWRSRDEFPAPDPVFRDQVRARRQRLRTAAELAPHPEGPDVPLPGSRMLKFRKVKARGQCKWGFGDPRPDEFRFCAADCDESSSWCASHHRLVYAGYGLEAAI